MTLLEDGSGLLVYIGLKLGGYLLWTYLGVVWLGRDVDRPLLVASALGVGRLVIGWLAGLFVAPLVLGVAGLDRLPVFYFTGLVLVRWLEWGVIHCLIPGNGRVSLVLTGGSTRGRVWRGLGVLVSYLADAPFLIAQGFPHGRILC
jgi:hypothetical protein